MVAMISGERVGGFVLFVDENGLRHAVKLGALLGLSDASEDQDTTVAQFPGGRHVLIRASLDEVLAWMA